MNTSADESALLPRCQLCHIRHDDDECPDTPEEGYITRDELIDAFRCRHHVCLRCQAIFVADPKQQRCPDCGGDWERFEEDDL